LIFAPARGRSIVVPSPKSPVDELNPRICHPVCRRDTNAAFTLLELAVVIAVLGVIAGLFAANLFRNSSQIKRAQCVANLKQFTLALHLYGNENSGKLPVGGSSGSWLWDFNWNNGPLIESYGLPWKRMYCPGTDFSEDDNRRLYNDYAPGLFRPIGYAHTLSTSHIAPTNSNDSLTPRLQIGFNTFIAFPPAERVLLADATISDSGQNDPALQFSPDYHYTGIQGGFPKPHTSPHLSGRLPRGGNVAMLDGQIIWRKFEDMRPRTITSFSAGFWW
jgi:prepilin-type N-terminal cleavage/methylation domain-containing protein